MPPRPTGGVERSKTVNPESRAALGNEGNTIGSNDSLPVNRNTVAGTAGSSFARDRSFPAAPNRSTSLNMQGASQSA